MVQIGTFIIGIIILLAVLGIVPIILGTWITPYIHRENADTITMNYFVGLTISVALIQVLSVPMTLTRTSFSTLTRYYNLTILVLIVLAVFVRRKYVMEIIKKAQNRIVTADKKWFLLLGMIFIPVCILACVTTHIYGDDRTYITMVNDIVSSDTLYQIDSDTGESITWVLAKYSLSSYWTWLAYLSKISGIHALVLCKTVLIFFFIPMSYAIQGLFAAYLFHNNERRILIYLFFLNLIQLFGGFSGYSTSFRLLTWVWQSKAFLAIIIIPWLLYYCMLVFEKRTSFIEICFLLIVILATTSTTLTGTGLAVGMVAVLALIYAIRNRKFGILFGAGMACIPAMVLMVMYLRYDDLLRLIKF